MTSGFRAAIAKLTLLTTLVCGLASMCDAADIKVLRMDWHTVSQMQQGACNILVSGPIQKGDTQKLRSIVEGIKLKSHPGWGEGVGQSICLNSTGGSFSEGVRLAEYITESLFGTVVSKNAQCLSACALAFMGGAYADDGDAVILRTIHTTAKLGFHRPFLDIPSGEYRESTVLNAYDAAFLAIRDFLRFAQKGARHTEWTEQKVKTSLVYSFLGKGRDEFFYIDTLDKAGRWDIGIHGYQQSRPSMDGLKLACVNMYRWHAQDATAISGEMHGEYRDGEVDNLREEISFVDQGQKDGGYFYNFRMTVGMGDNYDCKVRLYQSREFGRIWFVGLKAMPAFAMFEPETPIANMR